MWRRMAPPLLNISLFVHICFARNTVVQRIDWFIGYSTCRLFPAAGSIVAECTDMDTMGKTAKLIQMLVVFVILVSSEVLKDEDSDGTGPKGVPEEYRCVPGKTFRMECNLCVCFGDGDTRNAGCTRRLCPPGSWRRR
ncbi:uncharacterized protein LOC124594239 [Schistocerca americana]|uniref:uncharacterized protein LOC124594239 n=1 Tax=Schistocerca americana TaxID=7009 RepID=UPI001F5032D7|nr:uncharacterized protein LOC124594239 [Schistocerca americana]